MFRKIASLHVAALFVIFALPAMARAQALADRLPADTTLYVGWQGTDSPGAGFAASNLKAFLADSNLPQVMDEFLPRVLDRLAKEDKDAAQAVEVIRTILGPMYRHPTAIGFVGVEIDPKTGPRPKFVLLCQAGNEAAALKAKVDDLLKQAGPPPFPVNAIQKGDLVALVIGYDQPESAIPAVGDKSLANNPEFIKALMQVGKTPFFTAYVDFEKVMALADMASGMGGPEITKNWEKARDMLGLKGIHRAIVTEGFDGKEWATQAFVAAPAPRTGFVGSMLNGKELSKEILEAIPENATVAGATHFDLGGLVSALRTAVAGFDPDVAKQVDGGFDQVNQIVGFDIQKDFLDGLGDEWAYYVDPAIAGNGVVGVTLGNRLKDPAKTEASLAKLEDVINKLAAEQLKGEKITLAFRQAKVDGVTVHYLGTPLVTPSWAIQDGNLYIGLYPEVVAVAANQVSNKGKSIAANPAAAALFKRLGDHPVSSFGFVDIPRRTPENYSSWLVISHLANAGDLFGVPAPLQILPSLNKLLTHLSASGQITWTDADGVHVSGLSPFPGAEVFASDPGSIASAEMSMMPAIMLPALSRARGAALQAKSLNNLRQIGIGAILYANAHQGKFPADLGEVYEAAGTSIDVFIIPSANHAAPPGLTPDQAKQWVKTNSDYVWNGAGKDVTTGTDAPLAWENPAFGQLGGINILFGDGHVEFRSMPEAKEIIDKAKPKGL